MPKTAIGTGASMERDSMRRYLRRRKLKAGSLAVILEIETILEWLRTQPIRTRRPGGLGRK